MPRDIRQHQTGSEREGWVWTVANMGAPTPPGGGRQLLSSELTALWEGDTGSFHFQEKLEVLSVWFYVKSLNVQILAANLEKVQCIENFCPHKD